jgi:selenocysteine-specific elongation factor
VIVGLAGHVNHGKTRLVQALTGVDCDRLPEEKRRGMTLSLGFAAWQLTDSQVASIIDVPGHANLVPTMAGGSLGVDLVLLVIAADEGVMPQTLEHISATRLLGVRRAVVALTRCDRVDDIELARERVRRELAQTWLRDARIVPVCAPLGEGLDDLRAAVSNATLDVPLAETAAANAPLSLPIDRAFSVPGFGTVVTGSLLQGRLAVEDSVYLFPSQTLHRVRSLQVHGDARTSVTPKRRVAVNLVGLQPDEVGRGSFLSASDGMCVSAVLDVELEWLSEMPRALRIERMLTFLCGTERVRTRVHADGEIAPGSRGTARLTLERPVAAVGGMPFVLRGAAHRALTSIVGGGIVLDAAPRLKRRRAVREALAAARGAVEGHSQAESIRAEVVNPQSAVSALLDEAGVQGLELGALQARLGFCWSRGVAYAPALVEDARQRIQAALTAFHDADPSGRGLAPERIAPSELERHALGALLAAGTCTQDAQYISLTGRAGRGAIDSTLLADVLGFLRERGLEGVSENEVAAKLGKALDVVRGALRELEAREDSVRAEGLLFDAQCVRRLSSTAAKQLVARARLDVAWFKEHAGVSRKYVIPLLAILDRWGVTLRRGSERIAGPRAKVIAERD